MLLRICLTFAWLLAAWTGVLAQGSAGLSKDGNTYRHEPSRSSFTVPKGWEVVDTQTATTQPALALRTPFAGLDVLITWSRLPNIRFEEAVEIELTQLGQTYGKEKVQKKEPITVENKAVSVIEIADGPERDGRSIGVVYLFEAGPDANERWKVKVRAIIDKSKQAENMKTLQGLLPQFQW